MATATDHPFVPANDTWTKILNAAVTGFPGQDYTAVLQSLKTDSSVAIQPWQIVTNIGAVWGNTVDTFMRVSWPIIAGVINGTIGGFGDFFGPVSSTADGIVRFSGATGKQGADSTITITDGVGTGDTLSLPANGEIRTAGASSFLTGASGTSGPRVGFRAGAITNPVMRLNSGDDPTSIEVQVFAGTVTPEGFIIGNPGDYYVRRDGDQSFIYTHAGAPATNTGWVYEGERSEPVASGIISGGQVTVFSVSEVQVAAGSAVLEEYISPVLSKRHITTWPTTTISVSGPGLAGPGVFWVVTDPGFTGTATLAERTNFPMSRSEALLGVSMHTTGQVIDTLPTPHITRDVRKLVRDRANFAEGIVVREGAISEIPATRTAQTTDYELFTEGVNFYSDIQNPNIIVQPAQNPLEFTTIDTDGTQFNTNVTIFPATWNNAGVETALSGSQAAVHQLIILPPTTVGGADVALLQLGTTAYANFNIAVQGIASEKAMNPLWIISQFVGARIATVVVAAGATNWADGSARLYIEGEQGSEVFTVPSFDALSDTPDDKAGNDGKIPVVNSSEDGIVYEEMTGVYVWGSQGNNNTTAGTPILGKQNVRSLRWRSLAVDISVQVPTTSDTLDVDVKANGVSIVSGPLPSIGIGVTSVVNAPLIDADRVLGTILEVEPISTDTDWRGLVIELRGHTKENA